MKNLRELRVSKNLTLKMAAKHINTDIGNLSRIERGFQHPTMMTAEKLAHFYGVSVGDIFNMLKPINSISNHPCSQQLAK